MVDCSSANYYNKRSGKLRCMEKMMAKIEDVKVGDWFRLVEKPDTERRFRHLDQFNGTILSVKDVDTSDDSIKIAFGWWVAIEDIELVDVVVTPRKTEEGV